MSMILAAAVALSAPWRAATDTIGIARLQYEGGGDWYANPSSLPNLLAALRQRAGLPVAAREVNVRPLDPGLADHPYLYMTGHGNVAFSPQERQALRRYLLGGGFLHADDFWGRWEKANFEEQMRKVFPDRSLEELPLSHPVFHTFYDLDTVMQIPNVSNGCRGGRTWERPDETTWFVIKDARGNTVPIPPARPWISLVPASGGLAYEP